MAHLKQYTPPERTNPIKVHIKHFARIFTKGRFGFSIHLGGKEIFIGVTIHDVFIEPIIRRKKIYKKGKVTTLDVDLY